MARLQAQKAEVEARLADPALYQDPSRAALDAALEDQAHISRDLGELEAEWLQKQAQLEA